MTNATFTSKRFDIMAFGNTLTGRQGFAYTCNSMKYPILMADADKEQEFKEECYNIFGKVGVLWSYRNKEHFSIGELICDKGTWGISGGGACLSASFGFNDMLSLSIGANAPRIKEGQIVVVSLYSKNNKFVLNSFYKVGKVDIHCIRKCDFIPLTDEEMIEICKDAENWCR